LPRPVAFLVAQSAIIGALSSHPSPGPSSSSPTTDQPLHPSTPQPPSFPFLPLPSRDRSWMQPTHPTPLHKLRFLSTATPLGLHRKTARVQGKSRVAGVLPLQVANHTSDWMRALSMFFNPTVVEVVAPFTHSLTHHCPSLWSLAIPSLLSLSLSSSRIHHSPLQPVTRPAESPPQSRAPNPLQAPHAWGHVHIHNREPLQRLFNIYYHRARHPAGPLDPLLPLLLPRPPQHPPAPATAPRGRSQPPP
jgi:hypothetical protein